MKNQKKKKLSIIIAIVCLLVALTPVIMCVLGAGILLIDVVPYTQTWFWSYDTFSHKAERCGFALSLPKSQNDKKYYWYQNFFRREAGYGVSLSEQDYADMKEETLVRYQERHLLDDEELYLYEENKEKEEVDHIEFMEEDLDFVNRLLLKDEDLEDYYYLAILSYIDDDYLSYNCTICNDENNRIIELTYRSPKPSELEY